MLNVLLTVEVCVTRQPRSSSRCMTSSKYVPERAYFFCYTLKSMYFFITKKVHTFRSQYKQANWDSALIFYARHTRYPHTQDNGGNRVYAVFGRFCFCCFLFRILRLARAMMTQSIVTIISEQSVVCRDFTSHFSIASARLSPLRTSPEVVRKKVPGSRYRYNFYTVENQTKPSRAEPSWYCVVEKRHQNTIQFYLVEDRSHAGMGRVC